MYICLCNGITDREIRQCAASGVCSMSDLECSLGVGVTAAAAARRQWRSSSESRSSAQVVFSSALA